MHFRNHGVRITWLDKCLKSPVLEHPLTVNVLKDLKHCLNLHGSTLIILCHHSEEN